MTAKFKSIALTFATIVAAAAPALAQQVGTATAVNPTTESTPPGGSTTTLTVGARVLHKERIHTSPTGSVQLLFLDKSTLNIAPNTSLVIDEFVYDPASNSGHMLTKLTRGTLQYIGGQLSHQGAVTIETPPAVIGIRGATLNVSHGDNIGNTGGGTQVSSQYGQITITNGGGTVTITRPGFMVTITNWNTPPGQPVQVTAAQVAQYIEYLSSKGNQNGGVPGLNSLATAGFSCGTNSTAPCPQPPWLPTNTGENDAAHIIVQSTQLGSQPNPPPPPPPPPPPLIGSVTRLP
jgi:hypothetical protein